MIPIEGADGRRETGFLADGGEMGRLMREHDWEATSLGVPSSWPQALKTAVRLMLNPGHPMYIWWGPDLLCLYNDAYSRSIGPDRHPTSLGLPGREVWAEIWPIIGPMVDQVMAGGTATWRENDLLPITRFGRREDVYWTYSYSPIDDEEAAGGTGGQLDLEEIVRNVEDASGQTVLIVDDAATIRDLVDDVLDRHRRGRRRGESQGDTAPGHARSSDRSTTSSTLSPAKFGSASRCWSTTRSTRRTTTGAPCRCPVPARASRGTPACSSAIGRTDI